MNQQVLEATIVDRVPSQPARSGAPAANLRQLVDNRWLVLGLLFFVTAALGLPILWISRGFRLLGKIVVTIAVLAWTALVLWGFWLVMAWCVPRIVDSVGELMHS
jgi:hypothetical protein